jgi:hypothetical protein
MDFGWGAQVFWVIILVGVLAAIGYSKRNPPPPEAGGSS